MDTDAPTALPGLQKNPALIIGVVLAIIQAVIYVAGLGNFDNGIQSEDIILIGLTVAGAFGIKTQVFSQKTVDLLAPRNEQARAVKRAKKL